MTSNFYYSVVLGSWTAVGLFWLAAMVKVKRTASVAPQRTSGRQVLTMSIALALLFCPEFRVGFLGESLYPASQPAEIIGSVLTCAGVAFAIWGRIYLGGNWSALVTIKQQHTLIRTGPYAIIRHPIYAGLFLATIGSAIVWGTFGCFAGSAVALASWYFKAKREDAALFEYFGSEYLVYAHTVKGLIPFML